MNKKKYSIQFEEIVKVFNQMNKTENTFKKEKIVSIEEIKKGCTDRQKYIVTTSKNKYFLKISFDPLSQEQIQKTKWLYRVYQEKNIPFVPLLDIITEKDKTYMIYPVFEGENLSEIECSPEQYYNFGLKVSSEVRKMNEITNYPENNLVFDIKKHFEEHVDKLNQLLEDSNYENKIYQVISKEEINQLIDLMHQCLLKITGHKTTWNHNDVKLVNIMVDNNHDHYLVDIDYLGLTLVGYNVNYSIYSFLFSNVAYASEKYFLKGFIQGIDPKKQLMDEWIYFMIADFINELKPFIDKRYDLLVSEKQRIKQILWNENDYLETILYGAAF